MTEKLTLAELRQFIGTEHWYRHMLNRNILYTDGVQYLAEKAGAYWLIDEIALIQPYHDGLKATPFQFWRLTVRPDASARLSCEDGNGGEVYAKQIPFTDFPLPEITLYLCDGVILLPSEY